MRIRCRFLTSPLLIKGRPITQTALSISLPGGTPHTALKSAVGSQNPRVVQVLIDKGADVCEDTDGSALDDAIRLGDQEVVNLLVRSGAQDCG